MVLHGELTVAGSVVVLFDGEPGDAGRSQAEEM